jgi:hypothetical protein
MGQDSLITVLYINSAVLLVLIADPMSSDLITRVLDAIDRMMWCYPENVCVDDLHVQPQTSRLPTYIELLTSTLSNRTSKVATEIRAPTLSMLQ